MTNPNLLRRPSLWFVVPAHGRVALAAICLQQLRRACDELAEHGVAATGGGAGGRGSFPGGGGGGGGGGAAVDGVGNSGAGGDGGAGMIAVLVW